MPTLAMKDHAPCLLPVAANEPQPEAFGINTALTVLESSLSQGLSPDTSAVGQDPTNAAFLAPFRSAPASHIHASSDASHLSGSNSIYINNLNSRHQHEHNQQKGPMHIASRDLRSYGEHQEHPHQQWGDGTGCKAPPVAGGVQSALQPINQAPANLTPASEVSMSSRIGLVDPSMGGTIEGLLAPDAVTDIQEPQELLHERDTRRHRLQEHKNLTFAPAAMHRFPSILRFTHNNVHNSNRENMDSRGNGNGNANDGANSNDNDGESACDGGDDSNIPICLSNTCTNHTGASVEPRSAPRIASSSSSSSRQTLLIGPSSNGGSNAQEQLSRLRCDRSACGNDYDIESALATRTNAINTMQVVCDIAPLHISTPLQKMNTCQTTCADEHTCAVQGDNDRHTKCSNVDSNNDDLSNSENALVQQQRSCNADQSRHHLELPHEHDINSPLGISSTSDSITTDSQLEAQHAFELIVDTTSLTECRHSSRLGQPDLPVPSLPACGLRQTPVTDAGLVTHISQEVMSSEDVITPFIAQQLRLVDSVSTPCLIPPHLIKTTPSACGPQDLASKRTPVEIHHTRGGHDECHWDISLKQIYADLPRKRRRWTIGHQRRIAAPLSVMDTITACRRTIEAQGAGWDHEEAEHMSGPDTLTAAYLRLDSLKLIQTANVDEDSYRRNGSDNSEDIDPISLIPFTEDFSRWARQTNHRNVPDTTDLEFYSASSSGLRDGDSAIYRPDIGLTYSESTSGTDSILTMCEPPRQQSTGIPAATPAANNQAAPGSSLGLNGHDLTSSNGATVATSSVFRDDARTISTANTSGRQYLNRDGEVVYETCDQDDLGLSPYAPESRIGISYDHLGTHVYMLDRLLEHGHGHNRDYSRTGNDNDTECNHNLYSQQDSDGYPESQQQEQQQDGYQQDGNQEHQPDGYHYTQPSQSQSQSQSQSHQQYHYPPGSAPMDRTPPALPTASHHNEPIPHQIRRVQSAYMTTLHRQFEEQQQQRAQQEQQQQQQQQLQQQRSPYPGSVPMARHRTVPLPPMQNLVTDGPMSSPMVRSGGVAMSRAALGQPGSFASMSRPDGPAGTPSTSSSSLAPQTTPTPGTSAAGSSSGTGGSGGSSGHEGGRQRRDGRWRHGDEEMVGR